MDDPYSCWTSTTSFEVEETHVAESETDRLSELASIGAGHAARAFAQLTGRTIIMDPPCARINRLEPAAGSEDEEPWRSGVIFEFDGCVSAIVGILFRPSMCDAVVRQLLGASADEAMHPETVESALMEVGNVLASHVASAIADTLKARLLPSIPTLAFDGAEEQLQELAMARGASPGLRIECELTDRAGELGGLVVMIPVPEA
jgi:chemotaxis protein CheY-P-specific phosphatase CheC